MTVNGVFVPFLSLDMLIASKDTYREEDQFDRAHLLALKARR